ncbi:hypothetical protein JAAARDRAFT_35278 [Jaapia argillacea MUCL 33604]|uniref:Mitochondrial carrier n=1 Tax=Jaapia argillacea MUCL 33604 TaxID=933084 RepID=A0A067Q4Q8_9AGAM|nr:hypothetical protein JAAARDRAFT_35278 [Jaapia argillacea MUCL 33604]
MTTQQPSEETESAAPLPQPLPKQTKMKLFSPEVSSYFIAGGVAGAASRTVVSPLERLKIIQQVQSPSSDNQYRGVWRSLVRMWREEGWRGFMRGNGINCLRIVPYSAVQFTTYEQLKKFFTGNGTKTLDTPTRLLSGALAGITSVCSTYPLDLVRSRLSIATASIPLATQPTSQTPPLQTYLQRPLTSAYHTSSLATPQRPARVGMWSMTLKVMREEGGLRGLYRGMIPTAVGVAPYVGINFASYEALRGVITPPGKNGVARKLLCGALAGSISQTLTYPFDVIRRKMQVTGMATAAKYDGAIHAFTSTLRTEGVRGLYKGLWSNLLKVAPSIATSFFTYELVKEFLLAE